MRGITSFLAPAPPSPPCPCPGGLFLPSPAIRSTYEMFHYRKNPLGVQGYELVVCVYLFSSGWLSCGLNVPWRARLLVFPPDVRWQDEVIYEGGRRNGKRVRKSHEEYYSPRESRGKVYGGSHQQMKHTSTTPPSPVWSRRQFPPSSPCAVYFTLLTTTRLKSPLRLPIPFPKTRFGKRITTQSGGVGTPHTPLS